MKLLTGVLDLLSSQMYERAPFFDMRVTRWFRLHEIFLMAELKDQ